MTQTGGRTKQRLRGTLLIFIHMAPGIFVNRDCFCCNKRAAPSFTPISFKRHGVINSGERTNLVDLTGAAASRIGRTTFQTKYLHNKFTYWSRGDDGFITGRNCVAAIGSCFCTF